MEGAKGSGSNHEVAQTESVLPGGIAGHIALGPLWDFRLNLLTGKMEMCFPGSSVAARKTWVQIITL